MVDSLKRQKDKMSEVLITANSYKANLDAVKHVSDTILYLKILLLGLTLTCISLQALSPVIKAVDTALKSAEKRPPQRK